MFGKIRLGEVRNADVLTMALTAKTLQIMPRLCGGEFVDRRQKVIKKVLCIVCLAVMAYYSSEELNYKTHCWNGAKSSSSIDYDRMKSR